MATAVALSLALEIGVDDDDEVGAEVDAAEVVDNRDGGDLSNLSRRL